jgi:hypothetical protein
MNKKSASRRFLMLSILVNLTIMVVNSSSATDRSETANLSSAGDTPSFEHILVFTNLDRIHGTLISIFPQPYGLSWKAIGTEKETRFNLDVLSIIKLPNKPAGISEAEKKTTVLLTNGDLLIGDMVSLDDVHLTLITEYGGKLLIKRTMLNRICPPGATLAVIYSGPKDLNEWGMNPAGSSAWKCIDGILYSRRPFPIGKILSDIPDKVSFEFEVSWRYRYPSFYFSFCTENIQHYNGSYTLQVSGNTIYLYRYTKDGSSARIGYTNFDKLSSGEKNSAVFKLLMNKSEKTFVLLIDGVLVQQWTDPATSFAGSGNGIVFTPQTEGGFKISRITVKEWDGTIPSVTESPLSSDDDLIKFLNGDKVSGKLKQILNDKVIFQTPYTKDMEIPLKRISEILFARTTAERARRNKFDVKLSLVNSVTITFNLIKLENNNVEGESENFGKIIIPLKFCQSIEFNIYREKSKEEKEFSDEF